MTCFSYFLSTSFNYVNYYRKDVVCFTREDFTRDSTPTELQYFTKDKSTTVEKIVSLKGKAATLVGKSLESSKVDRSSSRRTRTMIIEEEKKQILAHKRKLLLYVRECRQAAEKRMQQLTEEECKQLELVSVEDVQRASSALEESTSQNPMPSQVTSDDSTITIYKPTKDTRVGLVLAQHGANYLTVRSVAQDSLFIGSLKAGMVIKSVNGVVPVSFTHGFGVLKNSAGRVVIVAGPLSAQSIEHTRLVELPVHQPSQSVLKVAAQSDDQKQNDATVTFDGSIQSYLVDNKAANKSPGSTSSIDTDAIVDKETEVAGEERPQVDQTIVNVVRQSSPNTSTQDSKQFIARVKNTFAHQPFAYSNFLELAMKFKGNDLDTTSFARQVVSLFQGYNDLILGFFSFLPNDEDETESINLRRDIEVARRVMETLETKQIGHIAYILTGRISQILDTQIDQTGLRSILHSLHLQDSRFVALFPTVDSLRYELAAYFCMCKAFSYLSKINKHLSILTSFSSILQGHSISMVRDKCRLSIETAELYTAR